MTIPVAGLPIPERTLDAQRQHARDRATTTATRRLAAILEEAGGRAEWAQGLAATLAGICCQGMVLERDCELMADGRKLVRYQGALLRYRGRLQQAENEIARWKRPTERTP